MLSRELSLYLEHQVRVGFFGSGVGLSLILGFSVAYACYYLSSIAKVSRGAAQGQGRFRWEPQHRASPAASRWQGRVGWGRPGGEPAAPRCDPFPGIRWTPLGRARES